MNLAIITPSYVDSEIGAQWARSSLASLENAIGTGFVHVVVDDLPRCSGIAGSRLSSPQFRRSRAATSPRAISAHLLNLTWQGRVKAIYKKANIAFTWRFVRDSIFVTVGAISSWFPNLKLYGEAKTIYNRPNVTLIRRFKRNGVSATLQAVREARKQGADLVFIHLDDNVYVPLLGMLFEYARQAFEQDKELMEVRLAGHPICSHYCIPSLGNRTLLNIADARVSFESVCLQPSRYQDYTLWWSYFKDDMVDGDYMPIVMWSSVYRAEFLEKLLTYDIVPKLWNLAQVEVYYKDKENWKRALRCFSGKLGYINMQFCGIDMHHSPNWQESLQLLNEPVR